MSNNPEIGAVVDLDLSQYQRSLKAGIRQADEFDDALQALIDEANAAEKALNNLSSDVDIKLDTDFSSLLDADKTLQSLDTTITPLVDVQIANDSAARALLDDFNATLTSRIDVETSELEQAQQLLDRLDSAAPTVDLNVEDSDVDTAKRKVEDLDGESSSVKITADTSDADADIADIRTKLENLQNLAAIQLAITVASGLPTPEDIPLLGAIIDADRAAKSLVAGLGEAGKSNAGLYAAGAQDVYKNNFGESQQDAADKYAEVVRITKNDTGDLTRTNEDFATVTKQAFTVAQISGEDFNKVIRAADTLVQTNLAPDFESAMDLLTVGFQEGMNKGEDFLDTIVEYSGQFEDLGFTAEEFFGVLKGGLDAGAYNTDFIADLVKEMNIRAQAAMAGSGVEFDAFKALGLMDEVKAFNAGEITGAQFMSGVIETLKAETASGKLNPQEFFDALGTKAEDLTLPVVIELDPAQVQTALQNVEGATLDAQVELGSDLGSSWEGLRRTVETELATSVSTAFDIPGKIQQFSDGVSKVSELLGAGATLPEAIEVAFQLPGFAEGVDILASSMGNLGISFMELVASVLDALGKGDAAGGVRTTIAQAAEAQLAFDLKLANDGTDFSNAVKAATERGVSGADVQEAILTAGGELLAQGDMEGAQTFLTALQDMATIELSPELTKFLSGQGIDTTNLDAVKTKLQEFTSSPSGANPFASAFGSGGELQTAFTDAQGVLGEMDFAATAQTVLTPFKLEFTAAEEAVTKNLENMRLSAESKLPGLAEIATSAVPPMQEQFLGLQNQFTETDIAFTTMGTNVTTTTGTIGTDLSTATGYVNDFAGNAQVQFGETTVAALDSADLKMQAFGVTVLNTMLQANADVQALIDKLLSIGSLDINLPPLGGGGGVPGAPPPGQAVGGQIEAGTLGRVHAEEMLYAGEHDVSVLNRQTSAVIDNALSALIGGGGGGNTTNYYVTNNVVVNTSGAAATTAAMDSRAIRGY